MYKLIYIAALLCTLSPVAWGQQLRVSVVTKEGKPVAGLAVSVQDGEFVTTDNNGEFLVEQDGPLQMPIRVEAEDERFEVKQAAYREDQKLISVKVERLIGDNEISRIVLTDTVGQFIGGQAIRYNRQLLTANAVGVIILPEPLYANEPIMPPSDYSLVKQDFDAPAHTLTIQLALLPNAKDPEAEINPVVADALVQGYEKDFDRITEELTAERFFFEQKNEEIRDEILSIQDKLLNENEITIEQKKELRKHLSGLEMALDENSEAIKRSEARTRNALDRLKVLLIEKDSINRIALGRIQEVEKERQEAELEFQRKAATYGAVILGLIVVLIIIYVLAFKYRKQKNWLKEVNKRLRNLQSELTHNIRELHDKRNQIEEHNQQLEVFVYKASHDIKGPLRSIMGLTQVGQMEVKDSAALEYFGHIHKSTQRLDNLLMDLLKLTKMKQAELEKESLQIEPMLEEVVQSFANSKNFHLISIEKDIQPDIEFSSDAKMMYSVIQNFVENGIKYCDPYKEQSILRIRIWQDAAETHFEFKDNGLGISTEHLPKIFDMFYKVNPSSDGTGLGLHIVKITIEKLGGYLKVRSGAGKGSVFLLSFPNK